MQSVHKRSYQNKDQKFQKVNENIKLKIRLMNRDKKKIENN